MALHYHLIPSVYYVYVYSTPSERQIEKDTKRKTEKMRGGRGGGRFQVTTHLFLRRCIDRLSGLDIREVIHFLDRRRSGARPAPFVTQAEEITDTATLSGGPLRSPDVWWGVAAQTEIAGHLSSLSSPEATCKMHQTTPLFFDAVTIDTCQIIRCDPVKFWQYVRLTLMSRQCDIHLSCRPSSSTPKLMILLYKKSKVMARIVHLSRVNNDLCC